MNLYKIADLIVNINFDKRLIHPYFEKFRVDESEYKSKVDVTYEISYDVPPDNTEYTLDVESDSIKIYSKDDDQYVEYNYENIIPSEVLYKDCFTHCILYIRETSIVNGKWTEEEMQVALFNSIREAFSGVLLYRNGILIHSSTIEYRDKAYVFSGWSGMGKSTHTKMWNEYVGTKIIDGDVCALRMINGEPRVYGIPWCGTSGLYENVKLPLGGIIFLEQNDKNEISEVDKVQSVVRLSARTFSLMWQDKYVLANMALCQQTVEKTKIYLLKCTKDKTAVDLIKSRIDENLQKV